MENVRVDVQPPAPVTVQVYVPAHKPVALAAVPPLGAQEYVNGPVPDVMVVVAEPVHAPLQVMLVCVPLRTIGVPVAPMVTTTVDAGEQERLSVTLHVYVPGQSPVIEEGVCPPGAHIYENGPVPPLTATLAVPVQPEQPEFVEDGVSVSAVEHEMKSMNTPESYEQSPASAMASFQ
jgi:hypothetical protein